jgi:hypothetical protein
MKLIKKIFPFAFVAFLIVWALLALNMSGSMPGTYSPLDTYINTSIESAKANNEHRAQMQTFIDSINNK